MNSRVRDIHLVYFKIKYATYCFHRHFYDSVNCNNIDLIYGLVYRWFGCPVVRALDSSLVVVDSIPGHDTVRLHVFPR